MSKLIYHTNLTWSDKTKIKATITPYHIRLFRRRQIANLLFQSLQWPNKHHRYLDCVRHTLWGIHMSATIISKVFVILSEASTWVLQGLKTYIELPTILHSIQFPFNTMPYYVFVGGLILVSVPLIQSWIEYVCKLQEFHNHPLVADPCLPAYQR